MKDDDRNPSMRDEVTQLKTTIRIVGVLVLTFGAGFSTGTAWLISSTLRTEERLMHLSSQLEGHAHPATESAIRDNERDLSRVTAGYDSELGHIRDAVARVERKIDAFTAHDRRRARQGARRVAQ